MAKKKSSQRKSKSRTSSKKRSASSKRKSGMKSRPVTDVPAEEPQPVEKPEAADEPVDDSSTGDDKPVEEIPEVDEVSQEAPEKKLGDAVAAVIGTDEKVDKKKDKSATDKKREKLLLQWTAGGYNVDELEEQYESGVKRGLKKAFDDFQKNIKRIEEIKDELNGMNIADIEDKFHEFMTLLKNPGEIDAIEEEFSKLDGFIKTGELRKELDAMVLPKFKDKVDEIREMLENVDNLDKAKEALAALKKNYKEAYFEEGVAAFVTTDEPEVKKTPRKAAAAGGRTPMNVRDIFLLYRNGKFISHHTGRVVPKDEQEQLFADLKVGRNYLKSPNYKPQKLNAISVEDRKILVQGGQFTVVVMIADGDVNPFTERIVAKVLGLMEKEDRAALQNWTGDVSALKTAGKYMTALLYAVMKLSKK